LEYYQTSERSELLIFKFRFRNAVRLTVNISFCAKRLERGCFSWPTASGEAETKVLLSHEELALLLGGIDLSRTRRKEWYRREAGWDEKAA
jgi:IS66 Orf2 like protein